ncbi:hypothetical protein MTR_5g071600 [Medicago truncatula]|uniref:Uncharacterized protein n=1 Tax=Medicago truncatula TaxID=3880 RepID=G7JZM0_MEDTR|nr:hypothetical protein MTR_5g071600 [Medicago truncatula]
MVKKCYQTELFLSNELISYKLKAKSFFFGFPKQTLWNQGITTELAPPTLNFGTKESRQLSTVLAPTPVKSIVAPTVQMTSVAPKPSFDQVLRGNTILSDPLPVPSIRGEILSVKITDDVYFCELDACKTNLRGRLLLNKGDKPYSSKDLADKLQKLWKVKEP